MSTQLQTANGAGDKQLVEYTPFGSKTAIKLSTAIVRNLLCVPTKSGHYCDERQAMKFLMLCRSKALNPFEGDAYLIGYDTKDGPQFSLITAHQAFLKRAEVHPEYDGMESGVIVRTEAGAIEDREGDFFLDGETLLGAWATVHFKSRKHPMRKRLRLATFRKSYGRWNDDPAGMIVKCAEADALRSSFPTMLGGMYLESETAAVPAIHAEEPAPEKPSRTAGLREKLAARKQPAQEQPQPEQQAEPEPEQPQPEQAAEPGPITDEQRAAIAQQFNRLKMTQADKDELLKGFGVKALSKLSEEQAARLLIELQDLESGE